MTVFTGGKAGASAFVSISFGGKTREIHFTHCRRGVISRELLKLGSPFDVVKHVLWKLVMLSAWWWWWRFHGAERERYRRAYHTMIGRDSGGCQIEGPAESSTARVRQKQRQAEAEKSNEGGWKKTIDRFIWCSHHSCTCSPAGLGFCGG